MVHSFRMQKSTKKNCPTTKVAELLSDTWTMLIMRALTEGPKRFSELEEWLGDISSRTLTLKLKKLKTQGLLAKSADGLYSPTKKGMGLKIIERAMVAYGKRYLS
jgi:DNA-binding HxlR family transcriptional regulator